LCCFGDVLLAVDEVGVGEKKLQEIKYCILTEINVIDRLTFLNNEGLNYRDKKSVQVKDKIRENG
jgi:hypothetical protein